MITLGATTLQLSFLFSIFSLIAGLLFLQRGDERFFLGARRSLLIGAILAQVAIGVLTWELLINDFRLEYVARYSSAATPFIYKFAGVWAGMEGSLLFWAATLGLYIIPINIVNRKMNRPLMPMVNLVLAFVMIFFLLVILLYENPFTLLPAGAVITGGGMGLNPLLQHPAMLIHPPTLYLGYVGFTIPFAFAIAALVKGRLDATWIRSTRRWTLVPWLFLTIGVILGGKWAYVELGWGGYWAWDPVENASFMPWLTGTAYLHSVIIQEKKNMLRMWNMILIMATFTLTIFGTYLTRSGLLSSVHAFAATDLGIWFFAFVLLIVIFCISLLYQNRAALTSQKRMESFTSREAGFLFNNMILVALTIVVLWGTMFPVLSEAIRGIQITVGSPYFNRITTPIGLILLLMTGLGPLLAWRKTTWATMRRNLIWPSLAGVVVIGAALLAGVGSYYAALTLGLAIFVLAGILIEFARGIAARMRSAGDSFVLAIRTMIDKNRRRYGGYIVHIGILFMFAGFAGNAFVVEEELTLSTGDSVELKGYTFTMSRYYTVERSNHVAKIIDLTVERNGRLVTVLTPEKRFYTDQNNQPNSEAGIYSLWLEDLYTILGDVDLNTGVAVLKIMVNPLVQLVWIGGIIMVLGTIIAILPSRSDRRLKEMLA